jgi:hypothetical protein
MVDRGGHYLGWTFLAVFLGGLLWWTQLRRPRDLLLQIDLTQALPGEITEVDVVVRRGRHALARHDVRYGNAGAPGLVEVQVHAVPGEAEVETTLVYPGKPARRSVAKATLVESAPARVRAP